MGEIIRCLCGKPFYIRRAGTCCPHCGRQVRSTMNHLERRDHQRQGFQQPAPLPRIILDKQRPRGLY